MDVVQKVSEHLFDDPEFMDELEAWCETHAAAFDLSEEHALAYTDLHAEFCLFFERRIEDFLRSQNTSVAEFWQTLTKLVDDDDPNLEGTVSDDVVKMKAGGNFVLAALKLATDYESWALTMRSIRRRGK